MGFATVTDDPSVYRLATATESFTAAQLASEQVTEALQLVGYEAATFYVKNTTDVTVTITWKGGPASDDVNYVIPPAAGMVLTAGDVTAQRGTDTLYEAHPFLKATVTPTGSPTTGTLDIKAALRRRGNLK